jgi:hypothetical protein
MSINERRRIVGLPENAERSIWELADQLGVSHETIRQDRIFLAKPRAKTYKLPELVLEQPPDHPAPYDSSNSRKHHARMLKTAMGWLSAEGLIDSEVQWIIPLAGKHLGLNYRVMKIPAPPPTMSPEDAILVARPREYDSNFLDTYPVWLSSWLNLCLPGDGQARVQMLSDISDKSFARARSNSKRARDARDQRKQNKTQS